MKNAIDSILKSVISFGKAFSKLTQVGQLAVVGCLAFVMFSLGNCHGKTDLDNFIVEYEEFKKDAETTTKYADSLKSKVTLLQDSVSAKETTVKQLKIQIAFNSQARARLQTEQREMKTELSSVTTIRDTVIVQEKIIDNLENQLVVADSTIKTQTQVISIKDQQLSQMQQATALSVARGDSLQKVLLNIPKTPKNPDKLIFGIRKPSRTTVFIVGTVTGILLGAKLTK